MTVRDVPEIEHIWLERHIQRVYRIPAASENKCNVYFSLARDNPDTSNALHSGKFGAYEAAINCFCDIPVKVGSIFERLLD